MSITRISKTQPLNAGQYWRAISDIPKYGIEKDDVLLIQRLHWVDEVLHSISIQPHPSVVGKWITVKEGDWVHQIKATHFDFLLNEFTNLFEFEPEGKQIREGELKALQARLSEIQQEMIAGAPATDSTEPSSHLLLTAGDIAFTENLDSAITLTRQNAQTQLATIQQRQKFYEDKQKALVETVNQMTPYFNEAIVAAQASLQDEMDFIGRLMKGLETLDLYLLKGIEIHTVTKGEPAPSSVRLSLFQQKLYMQEELAVYEDVDDHFDYRDTKFFLKTLASQPELQQQIFGGRERAVVCMATRRHSKNYGDRWANWQENIANKEVFLLVRNGTNIHQIFLSLESHLSSPQLFPSFNQMGAFFRGVDGSEIKLEDVRYVKAREAHEDIALHYFRFLILLAGIDNKYQLLGQFYEEADRRKFMTIGFQEKYFDFICDSNGANMLPLPNAIPIRDFIKQKNARTMKGSTVIGDWRILIDKENAPACYSHAWRGEYQLYGPSEENRYHIPTVNFTDNNRSVRLPVEGDTRDFQLRRFNANVDIESIAREGHQFLCLDDVTSEEIHFYIHNRESRKHFDYYFAVFKRAENFLRQREKDEQPLVEWLKEQLAISNCVVSDTHFREALATWRVKNVTHSLSKLDGEEKNALLRYIQLIAKTKTETLSPHAVALTLDTRNRFFLYSKPETVSTLLFQSHALKKAEAVIGIDNSLQTKSAPKSAYLFKLSTERIIAASSDLASWSVDKPDPLLPAELERAVTICNRGAELSLGNIPLHFTPSYCQSLEAMIRDDWRRQKGSYIQNPLLIIPVGLQLKKNVLYGIGIADTAASFLMSYASNTIFNSWFVGRYRNEAAGAHQLKPNLRLVSFPWNPDWEGTLHHNWSLLSDDERSWDKWRDNTQDDSSTYLAPAFAAARLDDVFDIFPMNGGFDFELKPKRRLSNSRIRIATNKAGDEIAILPLDKTHFLWVHVPDNTDVITLHHIQRGQIRLVEKESEGGRSGTSIQGVGLEEAIGMLKDAKYDFQLPDRQESQ